MDSERIAKLEAQVEGIKEDVKDLKVDVKEVHSRITTGNREIVAKLEEVEGRMQQRMQANSENSKKQHEDIKLAYGADITKVSDRVSALEQWKWYVIGLACAAGYMLGHLDLFTKFLK
jgi:chromosome segregation ATPase